MKTSRLRYLTAGLFLIGCAAAFWVQAAEQSAQSQTGEQVATERQEAMREIDQRMKSLDALIASGNRSESFDETVLEHAKVIDAIVQQIPGLFPEGTAVADSRAKPEIWEHRPEFEKAAGELHDKITSFVQAVETGDKAKITATYRELDISNSCASCHSAFRKKD